ncbi:hypothetical protein [Lacinutrix algicola]|uniref:hypothetical protein n=1 Tax=Lacinutrix algicola TaxID=342954 RepID=UPI0006E1F35E|nr:hypothetical protein [Lacinutrix algicola]
MSYINCEIIFKKTGVKEKEFWFDFSNELERTFLYSYDENKNLIELKEVYWDDEFWLTKFHYNKKNRPIVMSYYYSDEPNEFSHWYFVLDKNGNIIETRIIDEDGEDYSLINELNTQGKTIRKYRKYIQLKFKEKERNLFEYDYDKNGNKILQLNYNESSNKVYSKTVWKYDNQNNLIEMKRFGIMNDTTDYKTDKYSYNDKGCKIYEEETATKDSIFNSVKTFYNQDDYIIKTIVLENNKAKILDFKYKFDRKGNWTKITKIVNGKSLYVWTRKIKYY